ncbi:DUF4307 domain-containing protein [Nocardioides marmotae]|uniref:DUF4307 domain-containing protein n=1 Tax=Nocardioides marmotae TaxID=2663857 RepID=A0A6I3J4Y4_9ACTN|nr:DUF4307 domain-containing protein [Nocardioides marmotae]MCR6030518.1 DUF4307 domain-containing protein [Gordonia jinghuaiqii]MBC9734649.1 DUF4307 domain-containing protein [Nocardioides marmotae]MTB85751.1 DUF4307 domain-containing protein [Nocardioides marmotae]MTB94154.1 DUF4307 domain-containing protein [Nocardioides marmotae]QKE00449.1 DUF4307 domain-containing protein [Nocardioides marmotae]
MSTDLMTERYGAPAPWRRRAVVVGSIVLAVVFLGWLAWTAVTHSSPEVSGELETYEIVDEHTIDAVVVVTMSEDAENPTCLLRAFAEDHSTVGELEFVPDPDLGARQPQSVRTERRATALEMVGCRAEGQTRYR